MSIRTLMLELCGMRNQYMQNWQDLPTTGLAKIPIYNIIRKITPDTVQGYKMGSYLIYYALSIWSRFDQRTQKIQEQDLSPKPGLSKKDISQVKLFYPPLEKNYSTELKLLESQILSIKQGEQKNFQNFFLLPPVNMILELLVQF